MTVLHGEWPMSTYDATQDNPAHSEQQEREECSNGSRIGPASFGARHFGGLRGSKRRRWFEPANAGR